MRRLSEDITECIRKARDIATKIEEEERAAGHGDIALWQHIRAAALDDVLRLIKEDDDA